MIDARGIADVMSRVSGDTYRTLWAGSVGSLAALATLARVVAPAKPDPVFPAWQGMQYMVDMFSGAAKLQSLDNDRYADLTWTSLHDRLTGAGIPAAAQPAPCPRRAGTAALTRSGKSAPPAAVRP